jgi:hypothetical protein
MNQSEGNHAESTQVRLHAFVVALISPIAHADMSEVKQDIKRDSKKPRTRPARPRAARPCDRERREGGRPRHRARVARGLDATKRTTKRVFHKNDSGDGAQTRGE